MDEMKIGSGLLKGVVGSVLKKIIFKNLGISPDISIYKLEITSGDAGSYNISINMDANIKCNDIIGLCKKYL